MVKKALENNEGCEIRGTTKLRKVSGKIEIITERHHGLIMSLKQGHPELFKKFSLKHYMPSF